MRAAIALGSNLGDRLANLRNARSAIEDLPKVEPPVIASSIYETEPVDCEPGAPRFMNAVMDVGYGGLPDELLQALRQIEADLGRPAAHAKNTSRTLDLDLLYFGEETLARPNLQLPHPRMLERRFVLEPLNDIRPDLVLPQQTETVADLLNKLPATPPLVRTASQW